MNNQRMVKVFCTSSYCIEAHFCLRREKIGCLVKQVEVANLYPCLRLSMDRALHLNFAVRQHPWSKAPNVTAINASFIIGQPEQPETCKRRHRQPAKLSPSFLSLPLTLVMTTPSVAGSFFAWDTRQSIKCHVKVAWNMRISVPMASKKSSGSLSYHSLTLEPALTTSSERSAIFFRPVSYSTGEPNFTQKKSLCQSHTAMSQLCLFVPDFVREPTQQWRLLGREYDIDISFEFEDLDGLSLPKVQQKFRLYVEPCSVCSEGSESEQTESEGQRADCGSALPLYH